MTSRSDEHIGFDKEYPLPKPGDTLLKYSGKKTLYTQSLTGNWTVYTDAYKQAADMLIDGIEGYPHEDALYCPIIFLYRHFVELTLKPIARAIERLSGQPIPKVAGKRADSRHSILDLWLYIERNIRYLGCEIGRQTIDLLAQLVEEISRLDPDSMHTRYAHNRKGAKMHIPVDSLDIENLKDVIVKMHNALEILTTAIDLEDEWRSEQESW